jgi:alkylresorcinol/alkylpyrone synthase/polyketide synthase Type III
MADGSSRPRIVALATATPPYAFTQDEICALGGYTDSARRAIFAHSGVARRFLCLEPGHFSPREDLPALHERYRKWSVGLATEAAARCLAAAGRSAGEIDFLVAASCTGYLCPGLDALLAKALGAGKRLQRANLIGMGCSAALPALQRAWDHLRARPTHRVLVVASEICSAAYFVDDSLEMAVSHALFADGAAAMLLDAGGAPRAGVGLVDFETLLETRHQDVMGFDTIEGRLRLVLSKEVRQLAPAMAGEMVTALLARHGLGPADIRHWVVHPGGRRVIEGVQAGLGLSDADVAASRVVLRDYGNMSSPTILFVLQEVLRERRPAPGDLGVMVSLGPGFTAEGALLQF